MADHEPRRVRVAAVDLGATSGRVIVGHVGPGRLDLEEVHRFPNGPVRFDGHLHWDIASIWREVKDGLGKAGPVDAIGIDSWAVDYGLLDDAGELLGDPFAHRDTRTDGVEQRVHEVVPAAELYATTGLQQLPFNTVNQLVSELPLPERTASMLLLPDLLNYWLTGRVGAEATNASTTQLYDVSARTWATGIADRLGIPTRILPPVHEAGSTVGRLLPAVADETGLSPDTLVVAVGSHDTASAVAGTPLVPGERAAYISSGTWSLVGVELDAPVLTEAARLANFTNEGGVDGTIRFLTNVMGLWVLSEAMRCWSSAGERIDLADLLAAAAEVTPLRTVVDIDDPAFLPPGDMDARIAGQCAQTGQPAPRTTAETARCILDSLALSYRRNVALAGRLTGGPVEVVHVVGGGARNELLCQLTADACGVPVLAGPTEAAAIGNVLVQARALGVDLPDLGAMRVLVRETHEPRRYLPSGTTDAWQAAADRLTA